MSSLTERFAQIEFQRTGTAGPPRGRSATSSTPQIMTTRPHKAIERTHTTHASSSGGVSKRRGTVPSPSNKTIQDRLGPKSHAARLGPPAAPLQTEASILLKPSPPPKSLTPAQKLAKRLGPSPGLSDVLLKKTRKNSSSGNVKNSTGDLRQRIGIARHNSTKSAQNNRRTLK
jgi:hypothetical protein